MTIGCLANWLRNRSFHCAITGPLFLIGGVMFLLSGVRMIHVNTRWVWPFVLIGIGAHVNESQMEELDDLETGTDVDLWDHKLASEMRVLQEIFAEVVDKNARIADKAKVLDPQGRVVKDYSDTGMTGYLEFEMPAGSEYFTLEVNGNRIHQGLSDHAKVPPPELA